MAPILAYTLHISNILEVYMETSLSQTDRQTDKIPRTATHWNTAVYDEGVGFKGQWDCLQKLPDHVKELHKKEEICPTTGRHHFQIHVTCHRQVTGKQMSVWIKHTKWQPLVGKDHIANSIAYIYKQDTAAPGAVPVNVKGSDYLRIHELLMEVAKDYEYFKVPEGREMTFIEKRDFSEEHLFKNASRWIVRKRGIEWITKLSVPTLEKSWNIFYRELLDEVQKREALIIEPPTREGGEGETPPLTEE